MITKTIKLPEINDVKEFITAAVDFSFDVDVCSGKYTVDAKSIMGLFSLNLSEPVILEVHADEEAADSFLSRIHKFII